MNADNDDLSEREDSILRRFRDRQPVGDHPEGRQARGWAGYYSNEDGKIHLNETRLEDSTDAVRAACLAHERVHQGYAEDYPSIENEAEAWIAAYQAYKAHGGDINEDSDDPVEKTLQDVGELIERGGGELDDWIRSIKGYEHAADTAEDAERIAQLLDSGPVSELSRDELLEVADLMHVEFNDHTSPDELAREVDQIKHGMKHPYALTNDAADDDKPKTTGNDTPPNDWNLEDDEQTQQETDGWDLQDDEDYEPVDDDVGPEDETDEPDDTDQPDEPPDNDDDSWTDWTDWNDWNDWNDWDDWSDSQ